MRVVLILLTLSLAACASATPRLPSPADLTPYLGVWISEDGQARQEFARPEGRYRGAYEGRLYFRDGDEWALVSEGRYSHEDPHGPDGPLSFLGGSFTPVGDVDMGFERLNVSGYKAGTISIDGDLDFQSGQVFFNAAYQGAERMRTLEHWTPVGDDRFTYTLYQPTDDGGWTEWFSGTWIRLEETAE